MCRAASFGRNLTEADEEVKDLVETRSDSTVSSAGVGRSGRLRVKYLKLGEEMRPLAKNIEADVTAR